MPKRNHPQWRVDEAVYPVRVNIFVPKDGFGVMLTPLRDWLDARCGRTGYAWHTGHSVAGRDTAAVYFRNTADPDAFLTAWPALELADGTTLPRYSHPRSTHAVDLSQDPRFRY